MWSGKKIPGVQNSVNWQGGMARPKHTLKVRPPNLPILNVAIFDGQVACYRDWVLKREAF